MDTASTRAFGVFAICDSDDSRRCCADGFLRCNPGLRSNNFPLVQSLAVIQNSDLMRIPGHGDCVGFVDMDSGKIFQNTGDWEECKRYCEGEPLCRAVTVGDDSFPAAFPACWFHYASYNDCFSVANAHGVYNACFNWAGTGLPSRNAFQSYVFSQSQFKTFSYIYSARSRQCWYKSGYSVRNPELQVTSCSESTKWNDDYACRYAYNDNNRQWATASQGVGSWIQYEFGGPKMITSMQFQNRDCGSSMDCGDSLSATLEFSDGSFQYVTFNDRSGINTIALQPVLTSFVKMTITSVYSTADNGASILKFFGYLPAGIPVEQWLTRPVQGSVSCSSSVFGDPVPGVSKKECHCAGIIN